MARSSTTFKPGNSGNPYGRRGKPHEDVALLEAIERRLRLPASAPVGRSNADKLAAKVVQGAMRHGTSLNAQKNTLRDFKELLSAEAMLREYRAKGITQAPAIPWDDTPAESETVTPVPDDDELDDAEALDRIRLADALRDVQAAAERATQVRGDDTEQGFEALGWSNLPPDAVPDPVYQEPEPAPEKQPAAETGSVDPEAWLAAILAKTSPVPRFSVWGRTPKPERYQADAKLDYLAVPLTPEETKQLGKELEWKPLPEAEPEARQERAPQPYRLVTER